MGTKINAVTPKSSVDLLSGNICPIKLNIIVNMLDNITVINTVFYPFDFSNKNYLAQKFVAQVYQLKFDEQLIQQAG